MTDLRNAATAAFHALRSYQHGNSATELAKAVADKLDAALNHSPDAGKKAGSDKRDPVSEFNRGYILACSNLQNLHDEPNIASDTLMQLGLTRTDILTIIPAEEEYDRAALDEIFEAAPKDWPEGPSAWPHGPRPIRTRPQRSEDAIERSEGEQRQ
jgi:hypothetical protein